MQRECDTFDASSSTGIERHYTTRELAELLSVHQETIRHTRSRKPLRFQSCPILEIPPELSKNTRAHRVFLTPLEVKLFREQLRVRAAGTPLVFPTPTALKDEESETGRPSVFEGFTFHLLRHTACSLMASAGMDPAVAAERAGHTDGGALFLRTYRHLYEAEKRTQALRLEAKILGDLATVWTDGEGDAGNRLNEGENDGGRTWDRTRDLSRVKRALSR